MTGPAANQRINYLDDIWRGSESALEDAADTFVSAGKRASAGIGEQAFGVLCGALLAPAVSALASTSASAIDTAGELSAKLAEATNELAKAFAQIDESAQQAFSRITGDGS